MITWLLMKMGVAPSVEDFVRMDREFRERGHHITIDFGNDRRGWSRWSDDPNYLKRPAVGLGYDYYIDRRYHGVGFEVLTQSLGKVFKGSKEVNSFFVGGGLAYYPVRGLRLFTQAGAELGLDGDHAAVGRVGMGYRFMFFNVGMQPYFYISQNTDRQPGWAFNFRFEY